MCQITAYDGRKGAWLIDLPLGWSVRAELLVIVGASFATPSFNLSPWVLFVERETEMTPAEQYEDVRDTSCEPDSLPAEKRRCCPHCGTQTQDQEREPVLKRGAVIVAYDPVIVTWRGHVVPLSPTEAHVFGYLVRRGRATIAELDDALVAFGSNPATRSLVLGHIRGKFRKMGACDPLERIGVHAVRLRVDADERGSSAPVIGLTLPRYATVS